MARSLARPAALVAVLMTAAFGLAAPAAADTDCTGSLGAVTIDDTLRVPDGATCSLEGTVVQGNLLIGEQATLTATGITVDGNIQDDNNNAGAVTVLDSEITGNIQLEQGTSATVRGTAIDGDLQLESNAGALRAESNTIGGNLQANQNSGGLAITGNTIDGNLQCQSNDPAPTGGGNVVHGDAEGQCAGLTGDGTTPPPPGPTPGTDISAACPPGAVPPSGFSDVAGNAHRAAIDCIVWYGITQGVGPTAYNPAGPVTRDQMASFLARAIEASGVALPPATPQGFTDVGGNTHEARINQLAEVGVARGTTATTYSPRVRVQRAQMATFLVRGFELASDSTLTASGDRFGDDDGNPHEANINAAAEAGFTAGTSASAFTPSAAVRRDQMASFVARTLNRLVVDGHMTAGP